MNSPLLTADMVKEAADRVTSIRRTVSWWKGAHDNRIPYHDRYPGYCPFCDASQDPFYWPMSTPRSIATS